MNTPGRAWLATVLPFAALLMVVATFTRCDLFPQRHGLPPAEHLHVERVVISDGYLSFRVRADGADPVHIAQVMVDSGYWTFTQAPAGVLARGQQARIDVGFPWVENDAHHVRFVTTSGATFDHTIDIARRTPQADRGTLYRLIALGLCVGVVPVALGMLFFPLLKRGGPRAIAFVLALTTGLLVYLLLDMGIEGLAFADRASPLFGGAALVAVPALLAFAILTAAGGADAPAPARLAWGIALGIGLHNFGEGLALGAALGANALALGTFLVIGFTLHNLTEGIGIVAPLRAANVGYAHLAALAMLAGLPVVPGILIAAFALAPHWAAVCFGIGMGAIARVTADLVQYSGRTYGARSRFGATSVAGYGCGAVLMYATDLLIAA